MTANQSNTDANKPTDTHKHQSDYSPIKTANTHTQLRPTTIQQMRLRPPTNENSRMSKIAQTSTILPNQNQPIKHRCQQAHRYTPIKNTHTHIPDKTSQPKKHQCKQSHRYTQARLSIPHHTNSSQTKPASQSHVNTNNPTDTHKH